jgi:hypothetical protein
MRSDVVGEREREIEREIEREKERAGIFDWEFEMDGISLGRRCEERVIHEECETGTELSSSQSML